MSKAYITRQENGFWKVITDLGHRIGDTIQCRTLNDARRMAEQKNYLHAERAARWHDFGFQAVNPEVEL